MTRSGCGPSGGTEPHDTRRYEVLTSRARVFKSDGGVGPAALNQNSCADVARPRMMSAAGADEVALPHGCQNRGCGHPTRNWPRSHGCPALNLRRFRPWSQQKVRSAGVAAATEDPLRPPASHPSTLAASARSSRAHERSRASRPLLLTRPYSRGSRRSWQRSLDLARCRSCPGARFRWAEAHDESPTHGAG